MLPGSVVGVDTAVQSTVAPNAASPFYAPGVAANWGNGLVVIEALACGLPCVVSDVGGPKDLIIPGVTGFVTRGLDVEDFTRAV
jgi:glycosyltransferase involved in cell wall biosynthesis